MLILFKRVLMKPATVHVGVFDMPMSMFAACLLFARRRRVIDVFHAAMRYARCRLVVHINPPQALSEQNVILSSIEQKTTVAKIDAAPYMLNHMV